MTPDEFTRFYPVVSAWIRQTIADYESSAKTDIVLTKNFSVPVGVSEAKKPHHFDLGSESPPVLVECKSHTWTEGGNMPSAKMTVWSEARCIIFTSSVACRTLPP
jgi:hypothetical protein